MDRWERRRESEHKWGEVPGSRAVGIWHKRPKQEGTGAYSGSGMIKMAEVSALKSKKINKTQYLQTKMTQ